jgi:hypothetical protein
MNWRKLTDEEKREEHQEMLDKQREAYKLALEAQKPSLKLSLQEKGHPVVKEMLERGSTPQYCVSYLINFYEKDIETARRLVDETFALKKESSV